MTTEAYRVKCDGCGAAVVLEGGATEPSEWRTMRLEFPNDRIPGTDPVFGRSFSVAVLGHLCGECLASPAIAHIRENSTGYRAALAATVEHPMPAPT